MTTVILPGPWTPRTRICSISAVRLGPVIRTIELVTVGGLRQEREELVEAGQDAVARDDRDVRRRQQRDQARFRGLGQHHQGAGVGEGVIGAGDADIDGGAERRAVLRGR